MQITCTTVANDAKAPADGFNWVGNTSQFNKNFIKNCNEDGDAGNSLKVNIQYPENYVTFAMIYQYNLKE